MNKELIFQEAIKEQEAVIHDLQNSLNVFGDAADIDEEDVRSLDDLSHQDENTTMRNHINQLLVREQNELQALQKLSNLPKSVVEPGALVITDKFHFLVGTSVNPFFVDGTKIQGLETSAPIYAFLKGKKKGDVVKFGQLSHTIEDIL